MPVLERLPRVRKQHDVQMAPADDPPEVAAEEPSGDSSLDLGATAPAAGQRLLATLSGFRERLRERAALRQQSVASLLAAAAGEEPGD